MKNKFKKLYEFVIKPQKDADELEKIVEEFFTTYDVESINHAIKQVKGNKAKYSLSKIHKFFHELIQSYENNTIMAIRQSGDFVITDEYKRFKTTPNTWFNLGIDQQNNRIKAFLGSYSKTSPQSNLTAHIKKVVHERFENERKYVKA